MSGAKRHTCAVPVSQERFVAYWANELSAGDVAAIDEQMFACDGCAHDGERVALIVQAFRTLLPPVISREHVDALRAQGHVIRDHEFAPGERRLVVFERDVDLLIHHLAGLELADAERVAVTVRSEARGLLFEDPFAPFDPQRGEVLIACQKHFAAFPADIAFDVRVFRPGASTEAAVQTYFIPHEFR